MTISSEDFVERPSLTNLNHALDDGALPDDPDHPTFDDAPRYLLAAPHTADVRHDASDEFQTVTARAVFVADGLTGPVVELGPWSLEAADAHRLGAALCDLARVAVQ